MNFVDISIYLTLNTSTLKGVCLISFELQMSQSLLTSVPKALTKIYQVSNNYNPATTRVIVTGSQKLITLRKVTSSFVVKKGVVIFCSLKKGVIKNFAKFTGKHLCRSLSFNISFSLSFYQKNLLHVFSCEFAKFLKIYFFRTPPYDF